MRVRRSLPTKSEEIRQAWQNLATPQVEEVVLHSVLMCFVYFGSRAAFETLLHCCIVDFKTAHCLDTPSSHSAHGFAALAKADHQRSLEYTRCQSKDPSKIEWDLTNGPLSRLLELSVQWVLLEISWKRPMCTIEDRQGFFQSRAC